jgi:hypothetical protein
MLVGKIASATPLVARMAEGLALEYLVFLSGRDFGRVAEVYENPGFGPHENRSIEKRVPRGLLNFSAVQN